MTLDDGSQRGLTITLNPPKVKLIKKAQALEKMSLSDDADIDLTLEVVADAISSNREGRKFTAEDVEELFDVADLVAFQEAYSRFIDEINNQKNF